MNTSSPASLAAHYQALERAYSVVEGDAEWAALVVPQGNSHTPFHGWFPFKEGYSHQLLERLLSVDANHGGVRSHHPGAVLDPFSGSGTTAVSAIALNRRHGLSSPVHAIERNPVMHTISQAKIAGIAMGAGLADRLRSQEERYWRILDRELARPDADALSGSVTLDNRKYYTADTVATLRAMARAARSVADEDVQNHFLAMTAACVEPAGLVRRDGRALRFTPGKRVQEPRKLFTQLLEDSLSDLDSIVEPYEGDVGVHLADARDPEGMDASDFDWAICSPPYPNNIDYTEVYKIEAWALGFYASADEMKAQRLLTFRSHPSITFPDEYSYMSLPVLSDAVDELIDPLLAVVPSDRYERGRRQLIMGYADDMLRVLQVIAQRLRPGGRAAVVVGNSLHGSKDRHFLVASDLMVARLGELAGLRVDSILVARRPQRRAGTDPLLRESVVFLTRPIAA